MTFSLSSNFALHQCQVEKIIRRGEISTSEYHLILPLDSQNHTTRQIGYKRTQQLIKLIKYIYIAPSSINSPWRFTIL